jgi:hypothetical protein
VHLYLVGLPARDNYPPDPLLQHRCCKLLKNIAETTGLASAGSALTRVRTGSQSPVSPKSWVAAVCSIELGILFRAGGLL